MTRFARLCLGLLVLAPTLANAQGGIIEWNERCWEINGDALYWRPFSSDFQYGITINLVGQNVTDSTDLLVRPDYDWGFRIGGATYTHDCCHLFLVDWYYLKTSDTVRQDTLLNLVFFPLTQPVSGIPSTEGRIDTHYSRVNIRAGRYVSCHCKSLGYAFAGLRYVNIERHQTATNELMVNREKSQFEGAAFEVGYGAHVTEPCGFSLFGHVAGLMGIGERKVSQKFTAEGETFNYRHPGNSACLIGAELRLGLEWRYECGCYWLSVEAGYETHQYFDALRFMLPVQNAGAPNVRTTALVNAGFGGPFLGASVRF